MKPAKIALSLALAGMMLLSVFAGCMGKEEEKSDSLQATAYPENWKSQEKDIGESALVASDPLSVVLLSSVSMHNGKNHPVLYPGSEVAALYSNKIGNDASASSKLPADPSNLSIELAKMCWEKSDGAFLVADYKSALVVAPFASMLSAPVFYADESTIEAVSETMKSLGIKEIIVVGNAPAPAGIAFEVRSASNINAKYVKTAAALGKPIDYIIATNPADAYEIKINSTQKFSGTGTITGVMKGVPVVGGLIPGGLGTVNQQFGATPLEFNVPEGPARISVDFKYDATNVEGDDYTANIDLYLAGPSGETIRVMHDFSGTARNESFTVKNMPGKWVATPKAILALNAAYTIDITVDALDDIWVPSIEDLSASAAALAVYRHGIIIADEAFGMDAPFDSRAVISLTEGGQLTNVSAEDANRNAGLVRDAVNATVSMLIANGMGPKSKGGALDVNYLALVGGPKEIPCNYYWFAQTLVNGELANYVAYELPYGDLDDDEFTMELAQARFVSRNLGDSLEMIGREMNFQKLCDSHSASMNAVSAWKDTATVYVGNLLLEGSYPYLLQEAQLKLMTDGGYGMVYGNYGPMSNEPIVKPCIESSSLTFYHVHGGPQGIASAGTTDFTGMVLQSAREVENYNLGPGVCIASSCLTSKIDDMNANDCFSLSWLHAGYLAYFGATRPSLGSTAPTVAGTPLDLGGSNGICLLVMNEMIGNNVPMGVAMMNAKNTYTETYGCAGTDEYTLREFVLYGDPAFNPYEPCNQS